MLQGVNISYQTLDVDPEDKKRWDDVVDLVNQEKKKRLIKLLRNFIKKNLFLKK
jgi:hypothetical protein